MKRFWDGYSSWKEAEKAWDAGVEDAAMLSPLQAVKLAKSRVGIAPATAQGLKSRTLKYMVSNDKGGILRRHFLRHPLKYSLAFVLSLFKNTPCKRSGDFFLYNITSIEEFEELLVADDTVLIVGFSYCQKPLECPMGRFNDECCHDPENPLCRQCFIGKAQNALPDEGVVPLVITTAHYIGDKVFDVVHKNPGKRVIFMMTTCELALTMFGDWGNMVGIKGVGVKICGQICNTFKAFELAEGGVKPGLTVVDDASQKQFLRWIRLRRTR